MLDERLQRRLEALNRGPLPPTSAAAVSYGNVAAQQVRSARPAPLRARAVKPVADLMGRGQEVENAGGRHLRIQLLLEELWPGGTDLLGRRKDHLDSQAFDGKRSRYQAEMDAYLRAFPANMVVVDLETCGLAGSALFLIGVLRQESDNLAVELLLARNYAEEKAVLTTFWKFLSPESVLVTFNGKSFDWPMIVDRTARHLLFRGRRPPDPLHLDMVHHARRRWRRQLPDCRLQTLERHICGRGRAQDILGSQIPAAYHEFVRTGQSGQMQSILIHNAIDLVTLLDLSMRLAG